MRFWTEVLQLSAHLTLKLSPECVCVYSWPRVEWCKQSFSHTHTYIWTRHLCSTEGGLFSCSKLEARRETNLLSVTVWSRSNSTVTQRSLLCPVGKMRSLVHFRPGEHTPPPPPPPDPPTPVIIIETVKLGLEPQIKKTKQKTRHVWTTDTTTTTWLLVTPWVQTQSELLTTQVNKGHLTDHLQWF